MEQCLFCEHFRADVEGDGLGECRRFPPVVVADEEGPYSMFPLIEEVEVCGEFKRKVM